MHNGNTPEPGERSDPFQRLETVSIPSFEKELARQQLARAERAVDLAFNAWQAVRTSAAAVKNFIAPTAEMQRQAYLAGAVDRIDLEHRLRRLERRPAPFWSGA